MASLWRHPHLDFFAIIVLGDLNPDVKTKECIWLRQLNYGLLDASMPSVFKNTSTMAVLTLNILNFTSIKYLVGFLIIKRRFLLMVISKELTSSGLSVSLSD